MKRLMGRYATHENEVDSLLRAEIFVDLFSVVRHGIRASVESYSIKKLEPLYSFVRTVPLEDVSAVMARTQARLEMAESAGIPENDKAAIKGYNRDDCASAQALRSWLETVRADLIAGGAVIDRHGCSDHGDQHRTRRLAEKGRRACRTSHRRRPDDVGERTPNSKGTGSLRSCWIGTGGKEGRMVGILPATRPLGGRPAS
jgi:uncharacterized protein